MAKHKVLIASGISQEIADMLQAAPPGNGNPFSTRRRAAEGSYLRCRNSLRRGVGGGTSHTRHRCSG